MLRTTIGQLAINDALPPDLRDHRRTLDKKGIQTLLHQVASKYPDRYREVSHALNQVGRGSVREFGGYSFNISHLRTSPAAKAIRAELLAKLKDVVDGDGMDDKARNDAVAALVSGYQAKQDEAVYADALASGNPLAFQVLSGSRGNKTNLSTLIGSDMLYADHRDHPVPIPVLRNYSQGLRPEEYWAGTYGARRGVLATKLATQNAGYLGKQLSRAGHRQIVVALDGPQIGDLRGLPVDVADPDNEGSLLAADVPPYKRNTVLTPKILKDLAARNVRRILVRSPISGSAPENGVYAMDAGVREHGGLPGVGSFIGLGGGHSLSEKLSQTMLSNKHGGGVAGADKALGGFKLIDATLNPPRHMASGAAHAQVDGSVRSVSPAPAGGFHVVIANESHYVPEGLAVLVKPGDSVEAGDVVSGGLPNPSQIAKHKGVGEGRRYFAKALGDALSSSGIKSHRRNRELIARSVFDHVVMTGIHGDHMPDDVVQYSRIEQDYEPRKTAVRASPRGALGKYLERPVLHYTVGTKVRPSTLKELEEFGVKDVLVHGDPPPFEPEMVRAMDNLQHDPDWMTRMFGSELKGGLLDAAHRGLLSDEGGTSFVPGAAKGVDFGKVGPVRPVGPVVKFDPDTGRLKTSFDLSEAIKDPGVVGAGLGGLAGALIPADEDEEEDDGVLRRLRNAAIGAGLGGLAGRFGPELLGSDKKTPPANPPGAAAAKDRASDGEDDPTLVDAGSGKTEIGEAASGGGEEASGPADRAGLDFPLLANRGDAPAPAPARGEYVSEPEDIRRAPAELAKIHSETSVPDDVALAGSMPGANQGNASAIPRLEASTALREARLKSSPSLQNEKALLDMRDAVELAADPETATQSLPPSLKGLTSAGQFVDDAVGQVSLGNFVLSLVPGASRIPGFEASQKLLAKFHVPPVAAFATALQPGAKPGGETAGNKALGQLLGGAPGAAVEAARLVKAPADLAKLRGLAGRVGPAQIAMLAADAANFGVKAHEEGAREIMREQAGSGMYRPTVEYPEGSGYFWTSPRDASGARTQWTRTRAPADERANIAYYRVNPETERYETSPVPFPEPRHGAFATLARGARKLVGDRIKEIESSDEPLASKMWSGFGDATGSVAAAPWVLGRILAARESLAAANARSESIADRATDARPAYRTPDGDWRLVFGAGGDENAFRREIPAQAASHKAPFNPRLGGNALWPNAPEPSVESRIPFNPRPEGAALWPVDRRLPTVSRDDLPAGAKPFVPKLEPQAPLGKQPESGWSYYKRLADKTPVLPGY